MRYTRPCVMQDCGIMTIFSLVVQRFYYFGDRSFRYRHAGIFFSDIPVLV